jgi:hypothetical protein
MGNLIGELIEFAIAKLEFVLNQRQTIGKVRALSSSNVAKLSIWGSHEQKPGSPVSR